MWHVAEIFSPPRFTEAVEKQDGSGIFFDILQGWDLNSPKTQRHVDRLLDQKRPKLLVACPPFTHRGGWYHLNQHQLSLLECLRNKRVAQKQADFVVSQVKKQAKSWLSTCGVQGCGIIRPWPKSWRTYFCAGRTYARSDWPYCLFVKPQVLQCRIRIW